MSNSVMPVIRFMENNQSYIGFPLHFEQGKIDVIKLFDFNKNPGWIVSEEKIKQWHPKGVITRDGQKYLYGPDMDGLLLKDIINFSFKDALPYCQQLIQALICLEKEKKLDFDLQLDTIFFLKKGGILFLPSDLINKLKSFSPDNYRLTVYSQINHPYLTRQNEKCSYSIGALIYRILTGNFPYTGDNDLEIGTKIRYLRILSPYYLNPALNPEILNFCYLFFEKKLYHTILLKEWDVEITSWFNKELYREVDPAKKSEIELFKNNLIKKNQKRYQFNLFLEKNRIRILTITGVTIVVILVGWSFLQNFLKPRITLGMTPIQVVTTYYESINKLDHETMSECISKKAGNGDILETINLFISSRTVQAYEGKKTLITPDEWIKMGKPILKMPQYVFGISDLKVTLISEGNEPVITALYEKWGLEPVDENAEEKGMKNTVKQIKDTLYMKKYKKYWVIDRIDRQLLTSNP